MRTEDDYMNDHPEHRADHSHRERSALVERHKDGHVMSPREKVAELERELEHASAIAACSIGQPDRAANVAYREEVRAKLEAARAAADNPAREKVAEAIRYTLAIHPWGRDLPYPFSEYVERLKLEIADAAIAAHMEALKDEGHVMVKLPEPGRDEWGDMVIEVPITDQKCPGKVRLDPWPSGVRITSTAVPIPIRPADVPGYAAALLAAKAVIESEES